AFDGREIYYNCAERKGYSGTSVITAVKPLKVTRGIGVEEHDKEGRVLTLEFEEFFLVNVYVPNSQSELARLSYRIQWEDAFLDYIKGLDACKPVIICGDMNVAHTEIDLANPKSNRQNPGFSDEERACMTRLLSSGFSDTFRKLHPDDTGAYSWWSYRGRAREKNVGWRIDYFIVSDRLMPKVTRADIHPDILGSDHCPVGIEIQI
ncbi:MAG: exodeoxyribonuclease III, partial [Muribaculaceae bacterium]|nr:exodeoxyribonuclease III [Muribaculaceae bacterium]